MKKILSLALVAVLAIGFNACKKNSPTALGTTPKATTPVATAPTPVVVDQLAPVGPVPSTFTKKAVLEEFTGEWCGWCPEGAKIMKDAIAANPGKVVGIAVHDGDPFEIPSYNSWIKTLTQVGGFPNGSVDRAKATSRGSWMSQISASLGKSAELGLSMVTKKTGNLVDIKVFIGYNTPIPTGAKLTIAVIENEVSQSSAGAQSNYSSSVVVDANWKHSHVLRALVTANEGDVVDLTSSKKYTIVEFKGVDLSAMNVKDFNNTHIAAFINVNTDPRDILNAQEVGLNETKKWD